MDNILLLIKRRNQFEMKRNNKKYELKKNDNILENINNEIIKRCYNNFKSHNFIPKREPGMYGELFYVCSICGYEKL
jgi:hypothetical protein